MKHPLLLQALALLLLAGSAGAQQLHRYPVVGGVTSSTASVAVWLNGEGAFRLEYGTDAALAGAVKTSSQTVSASNDNTAKVQLAELTPATRYYYRVLGAGDAPISKIFSFLTFPEQGRDAPISILFGSCQQSRPNDSGPAFKIVPDLNGEFFVHLGDWSYPDYQVPDYPTAAGSVRQSYELRLDTAYPFAQEVLSRMGVSYVWDDHDYAGNNSDGTVAAPLRESLVAGYRRYLPHYPLPNESGLWHSFMIGNVEFFVVDARSQRNPAAAAFNGNTFAPPPGHSMLAGYPVPGIDQRTWLLDAIRKSTARWKVLVSPVFFNPGAAPVIPLGLLLNRKDIAEEFADKWIGYPADVDSMKNLLNAGYSRNMVVISGDAHTNLYDNGSHSIVPEFMAGNLDQRNSNLFQLMQDNGFNPWTEGQSNSLTTIGRIRVETSPRHRLIVESFDETGAKLLSLELEDNAGSAPRPGSRDGGWRVRSATPVEAAGRLHIEMENAPAGEGTLAIFNMEGKQMTTVPMTLDGSNVASISLPGTFPNGTYMGRMKIGAREAELRFAVVR